MSFAARQSHPSFIAPLDELAKQYELHIAPDPITDQYAVFGQEAELAYLLDVQCEIVKTRSIAGLVQILRVLRDADLAND